jgi:hypothetical protein
MQEISEALMDVAFTVDEEADIAGTANEAVMVEDALDAIKPLIEKALSRAENVINGRCRVCGGLLDPEHFPTLHPKDFGHRMFCRFYVGPVEHQWTDQRPNFTFGGVDWICSCGQSYRALAGATGANGPDCPNRAENWRGPMPEERTEI